MQQRTLEIYQRYLRFNHLKSYFFNVGNKSEYVPCQCCKKLSYIFKGKGTQNLKPFK